MLNKKKYGFGQPKTEMGRSCPKPCGPLQTPRENSEPSCDHRNVPSLDRWKDLRRLSGGCSRSKRTLLGTKGVATRSKDATGAPGIATRSILAYRNKKLRTEQTAQRCPRSGGCSGTQNSPWVQCIYNIVSLPNLHNSVSNHRT